MNGPYSQWDARNSSEHLTLAAHYRSADPIRWNGSMVYPMYTEQIAGDPALVTLTLLSAAPPLGVRGLGIGMSMVDAYVGLDGRRLGGVDVWSDALATGITFELVPTEPSAMFTLTPVWVDADGTQQSWTGNYGILVEPTPSGSLVLWCSVGAGPANFANLVVELSTGKGEYEVGADTDAHTHPQPVVTVDDEPADPGYRSALYDLGVAMYSRGEEEHACGLWAQAAEAGHAGAAYDLGVVRFRRGDLAAAEHWWRTAADRRESRAMSGLAELLDRQGNHAEARVWRACAAEERSTDQPVN
ncbi:MULTISPECIES: tetratricopeptide repeat protein [unclassified Nocardia]|uniref:tetratricopeptide repeat protein n=1 Tax=unclassified Nocardia TaxID=2637762 RepID=UPI001CE47F37|nr:MULTISPECIES: tetratricopeptide repeat protein [unclassified Nocardia]